MIFPFDIADLLKALGACFPMAELLNYYVFSTS